MYPASRIVCLTEEPTETLYLLEEWSGAGAQVRIDTISGAVGAETFTAGSIITLPQGSWADMAATTNFAPQLGIANKIYESDDRMRSAVYLANRYQWAAADERGPDGAGRRERPLRRRAQVIDRIVGWLQGALGRDEAGRGGPVGQVT